MRRDRKNKPLGLCSYNNFFMWSLLFFRKLSEKAQIFSSIKEVFFFFGSCRVGVAEFEKMVYNKM